MLSLSQPPLPPPAPEGASEGGEHGGRRGALPKALLDLMAGCFAHLPGDRPSTQQVIRVLDDLIAEVEGAARITADGGNSNGLGGMPNGSGGTAGGPSGSAGVGGAGGPAAATGSALALQGPVASDVLEADTAQQLATPFSNLDFLFE